MIKRPVLAGLILALLAAGSVNATEIYNNEGKKLDLYGKADVRHLFSKNSGENGDDTYVRFGFKGETPIADSLIGYGQWEYNVRGDHTESQGAESNATRLAFVGLKFGDYGSFDYGRNYGLLYDVSAWTDVLPVFGADTLYRNDNFFVGRGNNMATYRNSNFFGLVDGLNFAVQYQGKNNNPGRLYQRDNGDGWALSTSYDFGNGISIAGAYASSQRTKTQKNYHKPYPWTGKTQDPKAQAWTVGTKYDANNLYLAAIYGETRYQTVVGSSSRFVFVREAHHTELVAQYQFDSGLRPGVAYLQTKGIALQQGMPGSADLVKYVSINSVYHFNKNISAYIDYKINLLRGERPELLYNLSTDDVIGAGLSYQF